MRNKPIMYTFTVLLVIFLNFNSCCRTPEGSGAPRSPADGRFRIKVHEHPERYIAGEKYTIVLAGIQSSHKQHPFIGFSLAVEKENADFTTINSPAANAGQFVITDPLLTKFSEKCSNVITGTTTVAKTQINVTWEAPPPKSGCVVFLATIIERRDAWYMDDGPLRKVFCEDEQDSLDNQPSILETCCACDEAKYELTFEGLWSRNTHPKDFPLNIHLTRFSDIIGASHTIDYRFWEYGQQASLGVQQLAEHGSTRLLEGELKDQSDQIRTIIKARGTTYPNVTGKTFAVFRVDSRHHLVSMLSQIDPSPDWIVGVSGLELCLPNCSWIEYKEQNLYPWDAGTDSGPTYISPDQPTVPHDPIRRIKSNFPNDPRSPFFEESGMEMKPLARIHLSRQRLYDKNCEASSKEEEYEEVGACETGSWSMWSDCNVKCGNGKRHRQRQYLNSVVAHRLGCKKKLTQREPCVGNSPSCDDAEENGDTFIAIANEPIAECELSDWSTWSGCSAQCGKGTRTRTRNYLNRKARKKCEGGMVRKLRLEENEECDGENCTGDIAQPLLLESHPECPTNQWSDWSPCSQTCGDGVRQRRRRPLNKNRHNSENHIDGEEPCKKVRLREEVVCNERSCDTQVAPDFCNYTPEFGHCRDTMNRWFYDANSGRCSVFSYSGCGGNENNFNSREKCLETCKIEDSFNNMQIENLRYEPGTPYECKFSEWTFGRCNATCGTDGYRVNERKLLQKPPHGHICLPLVRTERCKGSCENFEASCPYSEWTGWTPCTVSCGDGWKFNTRTLLDSSLKHKCKDIIRKSRCRFLSCPLIN